MYIHIYTHLYTYICMYVKIHITDAFGIVVALAPATATHSGHVDT